MSTIPATRTISWEINTSPSDSTCDKTGLTFESFRDQVVATKNMTVKVPTSRYYETWDSITVEAVDGVVTVGHLLQTIYERYQKPLTIEEMEKYYELCEEWGYVPIGSSVLGECMGDLIVYEGLDELEDGVYELMLGS